MSSLFEMKTRTTGHNSNYSLHKKKMFDLHKEIQVVSNWKCEEFRTKLSKMKKTQPRNVFFRYEKNRIK